MNYLKREDKMFGFKFPVIVWKTFNYRCDVCGKTIQIHLQEGVEGPDKLNSIPSPYSINCPNKCSGFYPMRHVNWQKDADIKPPRLAKNGEYVFLYDSVVGCGLPVKIINHEQRIFKPF
jgi:hypothetical protein